MLSSVKSKVGGREGGREEVGIFAAFNCLKDNPHPRLKKISNIRSLILSPLANDIPVSMGVVSSFVGVMDINYHDTVKPL